MAACGTCGELLPHYCASTVTIRRDLRRLGHRRVTITDRAPTPAPEPVPEGPVQILLYPAVSPIVSLMLGSELDADGCPPYGWRREFLAEWDGVA